MKGKKLDEINARKILYSNKSLFKELDYELKSDMEFDGKNEINCQTICFYRGIPLLAIYIGYKSLFLAISFFFDNKVGIFGLLKFILLMFFSILLILIKDVKRTINNIYSFRIIIYFIHYYDIFIYCKLTKDSDSSNPNDDAGNIDHFFSLSVFINVYLLIIIINYIFCLGHKKCILLTLINNLIMMAFYDHKNCNLFKRFFLNLFSMRFIISMFYLTVTLIIQKSINRPTKKLWALFDSFKKSYLSIRNIFNNISYPIFIVKEDLNEIVFQNPSAIQFCRKYRRIAQKGEYNFRDIFFLDNQEDIQLFKDILKTSLENNETNFLFPFYTEETKKRKNSRGSFNMNIDSTNSIMEEKINFIKIYCFSCEWKDKIPCYYFMINENIFTFQGGQVILSDFMLIQMELEKLMYNINTLCLNIDKKLNSKNENLFFFYINLSLNFIYDVTSTNYIYNTFIEKKKIIGYTKFNFESMVNYLVNYITVFGLSKNFNINVEIDKNEDVLGNLTYMRAIFFNILLFIIENTSDQKPKTITIKRENIKYEYKKGNYEKIIFSFTDPRPILSYDTLKYFFQHFNYHFFLCRNPIEIYNLVNFCFLVPSLISETQYNINDPKIKQFDIETKGYQVDISIIIFFQEIPNEEFDKLEKKNFPLHSNLEDTVKEIRTFLSKKFYIKKENIQQENLLDDGKDDNLIKANEEYNLSDDKNLVNELRAKKYVIGEHHFDDIISEENKLNNFVKKKIKFKKGKKVKINTDGNLKKISFVNSDFKKFEILRILVIEEQSFSNESLFNFILKCGNECNIDIASDGNLILEKYQNLFKRRMMYNFIFFDLNQNIIKGFDAIDKIRNIEKEYGIHTKIIGIQNNNNNKNNLGNKTINSSNKELFDEIIPKSMKDFIELIFT